MRDSVLRYAGGGVPVTDNEITHTAIALAANSLSPDIFVDVDRFSQAVVLIDTDQNFTVTFNLSDDNVNSYELDQKTGQAAGKRSYVVNVKGARYLNVVVKNESAVSATLTQKVLLATG